MRYPFSPFFQRPQTLALVPFTKPGIRHPHGKMGKNRKSVGIRKCGSLGFCRALHSALSVHAICTVPSVATPLRLVACRGLVLPMGASSRRWAAPRVRCPGVQHSYIHASYVLRPLLRVPSGQQGGRRLVSVFLRANQLQTLLVGAFRALIGSPPPLCNRWALRALGKGAAGGSLRPPIMVATATCQHAPYLCG